MNIEYLGLGWKLRLRQSRASYYITIAKEVVFGSILQGKFYLYYYLVKYLNRNALLMFLDGEPREQQMLSDSHTNLAIGDVS